jgi:pimeloyl-ACP methyl ester carboxylesterase
MSGETMTETATGGRLPAPPVTTRPVRKDEIELSERGIYLESWLPERRSRRRPLLFVHGELAGSWVWERHLQYFAARGWEGHALNLRNHFWSQTADPTTLTFETYTEDVLEAIERLGSSVVVVGHGMGGLLALKAAERRPVGGLILLSSELPRELRPPAHPHELREVPEVYGRDLLGWETLPERLQRDHKDLALADILRIQHLFGQKPHESGAARRQVISGVPLEQARLAGIPILVIGAGLDRYVPEPSSERLAEWLSAEYEPFGAHSHYGLIVGESSHVQVAETIRSFLEANRL